ncbi:hypothetical protein FGO68_gene8224 [Halteria grandinella]|uniref:Uncharacterized protein n=1 Tax=Halteria grandinella TaxID=5974 RepID=A0A8J8NID2_HALGN|nr:hypothetical protein FGO68_gene8224 [Halteria grandinella]
MSCAACSATLIFAYSNLIMPSSFSESFALLKISTLVYLRLCLMRNVWISLDRSSDVISAELKPSTKTITLSSICLKYNYIQGYFIIQVAIIERNYQ